MRTVSFILAILFVVAGSSTEGSPDRGLPGVGTFAYHGSPIVPLPQLTVAAVN